ncbi:MAG: phosphodiester glycosidase family protein [Clostridia bacterium]|nr:phosphodiester glycosidase family protein [Clostridia bacterium]
MKRVFLLSVVIAAVIVLAGSVSVFAISDEKFDGETSRTVVENYDGVVTTHITLGSSSKYGQQSFWVTEFDPRRADLTVDVTNKGTYLNSRVTTKTTMSRIEEQSQGVKEPIVAINGDLWTVSYAHSRVLGSGTTYGGCSDAVVKKVLEIPRGLSMYNGEIVSSPHTTAETPYEGNFDCFGFTADGRTAIGNVSLRIKIYDESDSSISVVTATGLNRLPSDNAIMVYSDKGPGDHYPLDDAYEVIIDTDYDYCIKQDASVTGKVVAISRPGESRVLIRENRLIITARGESMINKINKYKVGDDIRLDFKLVAPSKDNEIWQQVVNAVGGHMILVKNGVSTNIGDSTRYPTSIIGNKADGTCVFITMDGRQSGYAVGFMISDMDDILLKLGVYNAFLLDGGGSADMVAANGSGGYEVVNKPSDGTPRSVINSIVLSVMHPKDAAYSRDRVIGINDSSRTDLVEAGILGDDLKLGNVDIAEYSNISLYGWAAANEGYGLIRQFGYSLDHGDIVWSDDYRFIGADAQDIRTAANILQGTSSDATRFDIPVPAKEGRHTVTAYMRTSNGNEESFWTVEYFGYNSAAPADGPALNIGGAEVNPGETFDVVLSIDKNPGIISLRTLISYDPEIMELVKVEDLKLLNGYTTPSRNITSPYTIRWADALASENNESNGDVLKLTFTVKEDAEPGSSLLFAQFVEARNASGKKVTFASGSADIIIRDKLIGDADGDGEITDWDAMLFDRYLAAWKVDIDLSVLDIDGDGELSDWDAMLLARYLAGWKIQLGPAEEEPEEAEEILDFIQAEGFNSSFDSILINGVKVADGNVPQYLKSIGGTVDGKDGSVTSVGMRGWTGFSEQAMIGYGYQIDEEAVQWDEGAAEATEKAVINAGGRYAHRFSVTIPVSELKGQGHLLRIVVKLEDGTVVYVNQESAVFQYYYDGPEA